MRQRLADATPIRAWSRGPVSPASPPKPRVRSRYVRTQLATDVKMAYAAVATSPAGAIGDGREPRFNLRCCAAQSGDAGRMGCEGMDEVLVRVLVTVTASVHSEEQRGRS